jgi:ATP-dependent DNA ligase
MQSRTGIVFNEHTDQDGATVFQHACKMGREGTVSKRLSAPYRSGPSRDWINVKNPDSPARCGRGTRSGGAVAQQSQKTYRPPVRCFGRPI